MNTIYFVIEIQELANGEVAKGVYQYDNEKKANQILHSKLSSNLSSTDVKAALCMIFTNGGIIRKVERYADPEPEENVDPVVTP